MLTVGELKALLANCELPDDAPVVVDSRHGGFHECNGETTFIKDFNAYGQAEYNVRQESIGPNAFWIRDTSTG